MKEILINAKTDSIVGYEVEANNITQLVSPEQNTELDELVCRGHIKEYHYSIFEELPGSGSRETDQLLLTFSNGISLQINTACSGSAENVKMYFEIKRI